MCHLQRVIDHESKLQDFLCVKNQKRVMVDLQEKLLKKKKQAKGDMMEQLEKYRVILNEITQFTGTKDLESLAAKFLRAEQFNFSKYLYCNELFNDMEDLSSKIAHYR